MKTHGVLAEKFTQRLSLDCSVAINMGTAFWLP